MPPMTQHRYVCFAATLWAALSISFPAFSVERATDKGAETKNDSTSATAEEPKAEDTASSAFDELLPFMDLKEILGPEKTAARQDRKYVAALTGKSIARVTARDPPTGFDPVFDAAIPLGIPFHAGLVRSAVLRLFETGRYRDVQIGVRPMGEKQVELVISVLPMFRARKLIVRGNTDLKDDEAARAVGYTPGRTIQPDPEVLRMLRQKLLSRLNQIGYREAQAELSLVTTEEPGDVELVVDITDGKPDRYTEVSILGLPDDVSPRIAEISPGFVRNREKLDKVEQNLISELAEYGYPNAVLLPTEERRIGRYSLALTLKVRPGIRSLFLFKGNRHFLSRKLSALIKKDGPVRTDGGTLRRKARLLREHLQEHGFLFAEVSAAKRCVQKSRSIDISIDEECPGLFDFQEITFQIEEKQTVDVINVLFTDNKRFTDNELEEELFAFIAEKNKNDDLFQPITPDTVDALGVSDKQRGRVKDTDFKSPKFRRQRVYVPDQYAEAAAHLTGVYQEQGFLSAAVDNTCDMEARRPIQYRGATFTPLKSVPGSKDEGEARSAEGRAPCVLINPDRDQLLVLMNVEEGPKTEISEIRFKGNRRITSAELQQSSGISVDAPYNEYRLREASRKLSDKYRALGHMFVNVSWKKNFSANMHRAGITFLIEEGPLTEAGTIRIEGAETTSSRLIRERLALKTGDVITPEALESSQTLLMELGIFSGATVQMVSPENAAPVKNIRVQVSEAKPQYLELKWGLATAEGIRGSFEYGFNNIGGYALSAALRARANYRLFFFGNPDFESRYKEMSLMEQLEHHVLAGLGSPYIPKTRGILSWRLDLTKERLNKPGFSASRFTSFFRLNAKLAIGRKYPHGLVFAFKTGLEYNLDISAGIETENPVLQSYLRLPEGKSAFYVTGLGVTLDLRDSPFNPTRGFFLSVEGDWVRSLSFRNTDQDWIAGDPVPIEKESNLIRAQATMSGYIPIFKTGMVFALSVTAGYIFHLQSDSTTWPDRYFYVGGVDTLRGFPEDDLVPEDIYLRWKSMLNSYGDDTDELLDNRGGEAVFIARFELRYPLAKGFYGAGFAEFGNLWRDRKEMAPFVFSPSFKVQLRPVAGFGIRYQTPLGPLSFDLGINLDRRPTEEPISWYISIGSAF